MDIYIRKNYLKKFMAKYCKIIVISIFTVYDNTIEVNNEKERKL